MRRILSLWSWRRVVIAALAVNLVAGALVLAGAWWVRSSASGHVFTVDTVPERPVVLVLGAKVYADGTPLPFLAARLDLAGELYERGKAQAVLVSGDNGQVDYNEVDPMREWMIGLGVPEERVIGDYAGFDTYDSCVRAKEIFGVDSMIVVTQSFHIQRAVALCRDAGIDAVGVGDDSVSGYASAWKTSSVREYGANVKALWDALSNRDPVHLGPYETSLDEALREDLGRSL